MGLTKIQQGFMVDTKLMTKASKRNFEVASRLFDDDRRDHETPARGQFGSGLLIQVKTRVRPVRHKAA